MNLTKLSLLILLIFCNNSVEAVRKNRAKKRSFSMLGLSNKEKASIKAFMELDAAKTIHEVPLSDEIVFLYRFKEANNNLGIYLKKSKYLAKSLKRKYKNEIERWKIAVIECKALILKGIKKLEEQEKLLFVLQEIETRNKLQKMADYQGQID